MQWKSVLPSLRTLAVLTSALCVAPVFAKTVGEAPEPTGLATFEPIPSSISLQSFESRPEQGNTLISVKLDGAELERLEKETGRTDFFALGASSTLAILRDDGGFPDQERGDGLFSALVFADMEKLAERSERDADAMDKSGGKNLVFANRALVGERSVSAFESSKLSRGTVSLGPAVSALSSPTPGFANAFQQKVLMITHPGVITDPGRTIDPCNPPPLGSALPVWSFGHLMTDMANPALTGINPSVFVEDWLNHWLVPQLINTFNVPARTAMQNIIDDWRTASGGGQLDLAIAPFRLMAINPRIDLRNTTTGGGGYGGASGTNFLDAGEGRFAFAVMDPFNGGCQEMPFTVILEYGVPLNSCVDVRDWAQQWSLLDTMVPGTAAYNGHLESLTEVFAGAGADPSKPNHSAINQVRSNENELVFTWELREFQLVDPTPSMLSQTTVADTADFGFNNTNAVNTYISSGVGFPMPLNHPGGFPFRAGSSLLPPGPGTFWDGNPSLPGAASGRHEFSLNSCSGCHARETDTFFVHINPAPNTVLSFVPLLSDFLTGTNIINPGGGSNTVDPVDGTVRFFDDLDRRETDINQVAGMSCFSLHAVNFQAVTQSLSFQGVLPPELVDESDLAEKPGMELSFDLLFNPGIKSAH